MKNLEKVYNQCQQDLAKYNAGEEIKSIYWVRADNESVELVQFIFDSSMTVKDFEQAIKDNRNRKASYDIKGCNVDERYTVGQ